MTDSRRGAVFCEEAYAQGKMLDNSRWDGLSRKITPSDVDLCFDNDGYILFAELSSKHREWSEIKLGQRWLYRSIVGSPKTAAALLKHSVSRTEKIDTYGAVDSFQVMLCVGKELIVTEVYSGDRWPGFVHAWYKDPASLRLRCVDAARATKTPTKPVDRLGEELEQVKRERLFVDRPMEFRPGPFNQEQMF